jgi:Fe-S cluster assembly protein SufB
MTEDVKILEGLTEYRYGFRDPEHYVFKSRKGLDREVVEQISYMKGEPKWMLEFRLRALEHFLKRPMPKWGPDLSQLNLDDIYYYVRPTEKQGRSWDEVPETIKKTFERLGIPEAERKFLAGVGAQYESEMVYHSIQEHLEKQGVIFLSIEDGLKQYPDLFREYFGTVVPIEDNKFAALNSAVWSGGSFVYVPPNVKVELPLQAYFRLNAANIGQFERTLIIVDEGAEVHYVEGCFLAGARVRTRNGEKPIETIQVGDEVMTHQGRYRRVYHTQVRPYHGKIYTIRFYGDSGRELKVTADHPLLIVRRERARERNKSFTLSWSRADTVQVGDYLVVPVPQPVAEPALAHRVTIPLGRGRHALVAHEVNLPCEPDFFRLLGYYLIKGHVDNEHSLTLSFNANETEYLEDARELLQRYFGKALIENKLCQNGQTLVLAFTEAARTFAREFGANVYEKRIPEWVAGAEPELLTELVKGMWRGDGSYDPVKNMFLYNSVSADLAYGFRDACLRLGIAASVNVQERVAPPQDIYTVVIASPFNARFGEIVGVEAANGSDSGSPFFLDENFLYMPIKEIIVEEMETEVYNFSVEEDESYVAEGVVSHNCTAPQYSTDSFHSGVIEIIVKRGARSRYTTIQNWSHNVYNLVTQRAKVYADAVHEWVDANLGCLAEGSTVTTPQGIKKIEDLQIGDQVLSYDETTGKLCFRTVTAKRFSGYQPVLTVSVGERRLRVTANHPFYSYDYNPGAARKSGRYRFAYVRADQLKEAIIPRTSLDYGRPHLLEMPALETTFQSRNQYAKDLTMTRQRSSRLKVGEYTTDEIMWLFGYWLGDGNIDVKPAKTEGVVRYARVGFSTPAEDRARSKLLSVMNAIVDVEPTERADGHHLAWNSKELVEFFAANGFYGKASTKRVPSWVWSLPESQRLSFIAGYIDADGFVNASGLHIKSTNRQLLEDIASLLVTLGITSHLHTEFSEPRRVTILGTECIAHGSYRLTFAPDRRLLPYVSQAIREKIEQQYIRKNQMRRKIGRSQLVLGEDVEIVKVEVSPLSEEKVPTWDIEVDGTGNFVSQGFIVHNSKLTMKYPSCYLMEPGAHGEMLSMAFAGPGQHQDAGSKMVHFAPYTTSKITSKSISKGNGRASYRGLLRVHKGAKGVKSTVVCDALLLDPESRTDTYPYIEIEEDDVTIGHEASVSKVGEEQLFYLMSRGLSEEEATTMIVSGFIEPLVKELPMEYAVEMNRLIQLQMEGSVG